MLRSFSREGGTTRNTTKTIDVNIRYIPLPRTKQNQKKIDGCCALVIVSTPVVGVRGPSCRRSPWPPRRLSPIGPVFSHVFSLPLSSRWFLFSPVPKNKMLLALAVLIRKTTILAQVEINPSLPRSSTLCHSPPSSSKLAYCRRDTSRLPSFGLWWHLPPRADIPIEHCCSAAAAA